LLTLWLLTITAGDPLIDREISGGRLRCFASFELE
jgi:hypothetical protein